MDNAKKQEKNVARDESAMSQDDPIPELAEILSQNVLERDTNQCVLPEFMPINFEPIFTLIRNYLRFVLQKVIEFY